MNRFKALQDFRRSQLIYKLWCGILLLVLVFAAGGFDVLTPLLHKELQFWHHWEVLALASSFLFVCLFYACGFFVRPKMFKQLEPEPLGLIIIFVIIAPIFLFLATTASIYEWSCVLQLFFILMASIAFVLMDFVMAKRSKHEYTRQDFSQVMRLVDWPMLIAFLTLLAFSVVYKARHGAGESHVAYSSEFRAFIGGAIAFQMIISNWVFALIFKNPGEGYPDSSDFPKDLAKQAAAAGD